jgi:hypothetical protein
MEASQRRQIRTRRRLLIREGGGRAEASAQAILAPTPAPSPLFLVLAANIPGPILALPLIAWRAVSILNDVIRTGVT